MARKSKISRDLIRKAEKLIMAGNYAKTVCDYLGIGETTWYRWLKEGEKAKRGLKREFWEAIKKAEAHAEIRHVGVIYEAARQDWRAAGWYLERKHREKWGRNDYEKEMEKLEAAIEKTKKEVELIEEKIKLLRGGERDTSLLEALIETVQSSGEGDNE